MLTVFTKIGIALRVSGGGGLTETGAALRIEGSELCNHENFFLKIVFSATHNLVSTMADDLI